MGKLKDDRSKVEFGDFQTPEALAAEVCLVLSGRGLAPKTIVEPTCGIGNLLIAAMQAFPKFKRAQGIEVNPEYVRIARDRVQHTGGKHERVSVERANFFDEDWPSRIAQLPEPLLFVGNPPWVTSSDLGYLKSHNIPEKANFHGRSGMDAVTGKSNFDISEWMLIKLMSWLDGRHATIAMLCKTAVARKALAFGWKSGFRIQSSAIFRIDSGKHFDASVDSCLIICELSKSAGEQLCAVYDGLHANEPSSTFGYRDGALVADATLYDRRKALIGESHYKWRSGVKHDCAAVMELRRDGRWFQNGEGERVELEERYLFPMLKSSDVAREGSAVPHRWMLVTQRFVGEETTPLKDLTPKTWKYLSRHKARFDKRASSIYRGKPPFSIFGVGDYTFAPWKVAISGLYKKLEFKVVGPHASKPVVLDDTCYFLPCQTESEARLLARLLDSTPAREFFGAFVFWDAKRPITSDLLRRLDLRRLSLEVGVSREFDRLCGPRAVPDTAEAGAVVAGPQSSFSLTSPEPTPPRRKRGTRAVSRL